MKVLKGIKDEISVKVDVTTMGNYGKEESFPLTLTYKKNNNVDDVKRQLNDAKEGNLDELKLVCDALVSWDVTYDDGQTVPLDPETFAAVWQLAPYRNALVLGYMQVQLSIKDILAKN